MKSIDKIKTGRYILWSTNITYQCSGITITPFISRLDKRITFKWKIYLLIIPFFRWLFNRPISYENRLKFLRKYMHDTSQLNADHWFDDIRKLIRN